MKKILAAAFMAAIAVVASMAQNTAMSPYSRYGYGILNDNATSMQRAMGGVGYAMNSGRQINVMNPASYAAMDSLTFLFDMGVDFTTLWSQENGAKETNFGGGLDYITMQVPITRGLGASLGLLPYGSVGYSFGNKIENGSASRDGNGSINQLYLGVGGSPFKGFAVGMNFAYLFGNTSNAVYVNTNFGSTSLFERSMSVRDYRMDFGMQYSFMVNRSNRVTLGVTYAPRKKLHGDVYGIYYDMSSTTLKQDTINAGNTRMNGQYSLAESYGAGINWNHRNRWMIEADFTYQPWKKAKFGDLQDFEETQFDNRWRAAVGAEFIPSVRGGYFSRIRYRLGASYNNDYIMVRGNHVRDLGVSMGFGLPVPGFKTLVNLGVEYKMRKAHPNPLLKEQYLNVTLGVNFNEMWFRKNKLY